MSTVPVLTAIRARRLASVPEGSAGHFNDGIFNRTDTIRRSVNESLMNSTRGSIDVSRGEAAVVLSRHVATGEMDRIQAVSGYTAIGG